MEGPQNTVRLSFRSSCRFPPTVNIREKKNPTEFHAEGWKKEPFLNIPKHS